MNDLSSVILSDVHCIFLRTMSVSFFTIELCGVIHGSAAVESPQSEYNEARDEPTSSVPTLPSLISFRPPKMPKSETSKKCNEANTNERVESSIPSMNLN